MFIVDKIILVPAKWFIRFMSIIILIAACILVYIVRYTSTPQGEIVNEFRIDTYGSLVNLSHNTNVSDLNACKKDHVGRWIHNENDSHECTITFDNNSYTFHSYPCYIECEEYAYAEERIPITVMSYEYENGVIVRKITKIGKCEVMEEKCEEKK